MPKSVLSIIIFIVCISTFTEVKAGDAVFGPVTVEGNTSTSTQLILKELGIRPGAPLDYDQVDEAWERLEDLGWFAFVEIELDEQNEIVPVLVTVEEDRTTMGYPLIEYDRRYDIRLGLKVYDTNLRGHGEKVSLSGVWYRQHRYEAVWTHPWLFGFAGLSWGLDGFWENSPFIYRDFDFRARGLSSWLRWERQRPFFAVLRVSRTCFKQDEIFSDEAGAWNTDRRRRWSFAATIGIDSRDLTWYPRRGAYDRIIATHHFSNDFSSFNEIVGDLRQFLPLPWKHVLALHAWGRRLDGHVPPEDLLFWGGPENLRGHDYASFTGEEGWLLSAEYRWPLFVMPVTADGRVLAVGFHVFGDLGANWFDGGTAEPRHDFGLGLHLGLWNRQFRFEVARTDDERTVFQFMDNFNF